MNPKGTTLSFSLQPLREVSEAWCSLFREGGTKQPQFRSCSNALHFWLQKCTRSGIGRCSALPGGTGCDSDSDGKGTRATAKPLWEGSGHIPAFLVGRTDEPGAAFAWGRSDISRLRASTAPARATGAASAAPAPSWTYSRGGNFSERASHSPKSPFQRAVTRCLSPRERCSIPLHPSRAPPHPARSIPGCQAWPAPCPPPCVSPAPSAVYCSNCTGAVLVLASSWKEARGLYHRALTKMLLTGMYGELREREIKKVNSVWKMFKAQGFLQKLEKVFQEYKLVSH